VATALWAMAENRHFDPSDYATGGVMTEGASTSTQMEWSGETIGRFWRWQAGFPSHYFTYRFGDRIAAGLGPFLHGCHSVVDYGCGPGFLLPHLAALGLEVAATDTSPDALAAAQERNVSLPGFLGAAPANQLIAEGLRFDAAIAIEVIEHLDDRGLDQFFSNMKRLVKPGGMAIITTPNEELLEESAVYCPHCDHSFHRYQHLRSWSAETLASAVAENGFIVEQIYTTDFSKRPFGDLVGTLKRLTKQVLGRPEKRPHLVCVARLPG